jgi:DNA-binding NtrC family response regulator
MTDLPPRFSCVFLGSSQEDFERASALLSAARIRLHHAALLEQAERLLRAEDCRVLLVDAAFPGGTWRDALTMTQKGNPAVTLVVTSAQADERFWLDVLEQGAYDLILKPFVADELLRILDNANAIGRAAPDAGRTRTAGRAA